MQIAAQAALVTGGASGLGAQTVRELSAQGAKVPILNGNLETAQALAQEVSGLAPRCDICDSNSVATALDAAREGHGPARILVSAAGIGAPSD